MLVRSIRFRAVGLALALVLLLGLMVQSASAGLGFWSKLDLDNLRVNDVDYNPDNPNIMLAGTNGQGIFRSVDGGLTWTQVNTGLGNLFVNYIAFEHTSPNNVLAATGAGASLGDPTAGVYRSTDGGLTWVQVLQAPTIWNIERDPKNQSVVYAAGGPPVFKSIDGGVSWVVQFTPGTPIGNIEATYVSVNQADSNIVLVVGNTATGEGQVFRSTNAGGSWTRVLAGQAPILTAKVGGNAQVNSNLVYFGGVGGIFRSADTGLTWVKTFGAKAPIEVRDIRVNRDNTNRIFAGTNGGVFWSQDTGLTWALLDGTLGNPSVRGFHYDRSNKTLHAGTDNGLWAFTFLP